MIKHSLDQIRNKIALRVAARGGGEVTLIAVSKTHPAAAVVEAMEAGQRVFGENRVQELLSKAREVPAEARWHLVGHLQKNKIRKVLPVCEMLHGIDSLDLVRAIDRIAGELGLIPSILLEVNVGGEASKFGFPPESLDAAMESILECRQIKVEGLMTIPPAMNPPELARPCFCQLRTLRDRLQSGFGQPLPVLSMGMSGDFEVAIDEGATHVRIGTAIFGSRL